MVLAQPQPQERDRSGQRGNSRHGRRGEARRGKARHGKAGKARQGVAGQGTARQARHGEARHGKAWQGRRGKHPQVSANQHRHLRQIKQLMEIEMAIKIKAIETKKYRFGIVGITPLIQHKWSSKAMKMMRMTAAQRKKQPKVERNPEEEAAACVYQTDDGQVGFPLLAFKASLISAAHKDLGIEKTVVKKAFFVPCADSNNVVPMTASDPIVREDVVTIGTNQTDLRYRPEFNEWKATIECQIDSSMLTIGDVLNLVNRAGFGIGIGEWRPEKGGEYGRFDIDTTIPVEEL